MDGECLDIECEISLSKKLRAIIGNQGSVGMVIIANDVKDGKGRAIIKMESGPSDDGFDINILRQSIGKEAYEEFEEKLREYDEYRDERRSEFPATEIYDYLVREWNKAKAEYEQNKQNQTQEIAASSEAMKKTAVKKIPEAAEIAAYVEALKLFLKNGKIKDKVIANLVKKLPFPDSIRMGFSNQECRIVFESVAYAWRKLTKQNLVEETKIEHPQKGLEGNYWMVTGGVLLEGPNHYTIIKQNLNLFATLLNISPFVLHEKLASPPEEIIKTVIDHGGMRIFINKDKKGFFQLADDTYSKWGRHKVKGLDLSNKTVKVIDRTRPYKGWDTGVLIKL
jgi:hypothetical protein